MTYAAPRRPRWLVAGHAAEITFQSERELLAYLERNGRRIRHWFSDGTFTTEEIPRDNDPRAALLAVEHK